MPVDPADYPTTSRGYRYPTQINAGGSAANAETDPPADLKRLADDVDADVAAVEAAAGAASSGVASDLADHEAATTGVHGIADTSVLVTSARQVIAGTGLTGGGTLAADRTLAVAYGSSAGTAAQGNDSRLSDTRTPTDGTVTTAKIDAGGIAKTAVTGTAITAADTGTVTDTMLAGSITPSKVTGTAVVASLVDAKGDLFSGTAADTVGRLAVGNNGDLLVASSGATPGLAWRAPSPITASATGVTLDRANPVYTFTGGSVTATLPTASTHTGVRFLIRNAGTGTVTVSGVSGLTIPGTGYVDVVSDGSAWVVLEGAYATSAVGLASYRWNQATSAWRLIAYDTGLRQTSSWDVAGTVTGDALPTGWEPRTGESGWIRWLRTRDTATVFVRAIQASAASPDPIIIPSGFLAQDDIQALIPMPTVAQTRAWAVIGEDQLRRASSNVFTIGDASGEFAMSWPAVPTLPTSLPGTQVTAPV